MISNTPQLERKREKGKEREREKVSQRFSPHVESQYIFYTALSLQTREKLSIYNFLSLFLSLSLSFSLFLSPSLVSLYLRCLALQ
jgi:hypothetical protein